MQDLLTIDGHVRCGWSGQHALYQRYHDTEWGVPCFDDRQLFEMLILEGAQAGLSWWTILQKRARYQEVFDHFDAEKISCYDATKVANLLADPGIVRNRLKVHAAITNAQAYLNIIEKTGSFSQFIWQFVDGEPKQNNWQQLHQVPATTNVSDMMSKILKQKGFKFVGSTICYAFMQAVGLVNDHLTSCWVHKKRESNT